MCRLPPGVAGVPAAVGHTVSACHVCGEEEEEVGDLLVQVRASPKPYGAVGLGPCSYPSFQGCSRPSSFWEELGMQRLTRALRSACCAVLCHRSATPARW